MKYEVGFQYVGLGFGVLILFMGCNENNNHIYYETFLMEKLSLKDRSNPYVKYIEKNPFQDKYLFPLIKSILDKDNLLSSYPDSSIYYQDLATKLSYIGLIEESIDAWKQRSTLNEGSLEEIEGIDLKEFNSIIPITSKIIMFNESHSSPSHRATIAFLLPTLKNKDYRKLGLEALNIYDEERLNRDQFPIQSSGSYLSDPVYANLVRLSLKLGFRVFGYEAFEELNNREEGQARNIIRNDTLTEGKTIILAGFGHIREKSIGTWKPMASYLKDLYDTDPFTIDQTFILNDSHFKRPFVPSINGNMQGVGKYEGFVDAHIVYPYSYLIEDNNYLDNNEYFKKIDIPSPSGEAVLQQSYSVLESQNYDLDRLVPLDQNLVSERRKKHTIPAWYRTVLYVERNITGNIIYSEQYNIP